MARWILSSYGGPKRVNHAAVAMGDNIYSFGGYTATEVGPKMILLTFMYSTLFFLLVTYRWELLPTFPSESGKKPRSSTISASHPETPSTSQSTQIQRRRTRSLSTSASSHPLAQIRNSNPPLYDLEGIEHNLEENQANSNNTSILEEDNEMDVTQATDTFTVYQQILSDVD
uniref:Uncharacterized protein n=1 Tax=Meloidogyne enterolobii TaxID=390850 RepID=A0A6V7X4A8_MELEN|nr:unnamed protein product [Meloidogyne enterolobii]